VEVAAFEAGEGGRGGELDDGDGVVVAGADGGEALLDEEAVGEGPEFGVGEGLVGAEGDLGLEGGLVVGDAEVEPLGAEVEEAGKFGLGGEGDLGGDESGEEGKEERGRGGEQDEWGERPGADGG
jgi:hypothetical protein